MNDRKTDLQGAAGMLGKSQRQIMRLVKAGRIPAAGGGRGVPYSFDVAALRALAGNAAGIELLARARHGYATHSIGDGMTFCLWKQTPARVAAVMLRDGLPPLRTVPPSVRAWARHLGGLLSPQEMRMLAALFIAAEFPTMNPNTRRDRARDMQAALSRIDKGRDRAAVEHFLAAALTGDRAAILGKPDPFMQPGDPIPLRFPELNPTAGAVLDYTRAAARRARVQGQEKPSGPAVAHILGVSRPWVGALWGRVQGKIGVHRVPELIFSALEWGGLSAQHVPRFMAESLRRAKRGNVRRKAPSTEPAGSIYDDSPLAAWGSRVRDVYEPDRSRV